MSEIARSDSSPIKPGATESVLRLVSWANPPQDKAGEEVAGGIGGKAQPVRVGETGEGTLNEIAQT